MLENFGTCQIHHISNLLQQTRTLVAELTVSDGLRNLVRGSGHIVLLVVERGCRCSLATHGADGFGLGLGHWRLRNRRLGGDGLWLRRVHGRGGQC